MDSLNKELLIAFGIKEFAQNDTYIEELFKYKKWSSHGSYIFDNSEFMEIFIDKFPNFHNDFDSFKKLMHYWLPLRINYIVDSIIDELNYSKNIYRKLYVNNDHFLFLEKNNTISVSDVGVFWSSFKYVDAYNVDPNNSNKMKAIKLKSTFNNDNINWIETFRSRIDFENGDDECEFYLKNDKTINIEIIYSEF